MKTDLTEARRWLARCGLDCPPWVRLKDYALAFSAPELSFDADVEKVTVTARSRVVEHRSFALPVWVTATYIAWTKPAYVPDVAVWKNFLLLASRLPNLRAQIETAYRLGGYEATVPLIHEHVQALVARTDEAVVLRAIDSLQKRRMRRIAGRPGFAGDLPKRPSDSAFAAEALPPRVKKPV